MREHEVPTHVQAEDRVLLWLTFPQVVAVTAVCALAYGAYRYAPLGPSEARLALAVVLGLVGVAAIVGRVGGRGLPLVAADLLRFRLGPRRYAGTPAQLARSQPPAAPVRSAPGPLELAARRVMRSPLRRGRDRERRNGGATSRPRGWSPRGRKRGEGGKDNGDRRGMKGARGKGMRKWCAVAGVAVLAAVAVMVPQVVLADDPAPGENRWSDEIEFRPPDPVPGRRLFVEGLEVSGDRAEVVLRAATDLDLWVTAHGGRQGRELRFRGAASLEEGEGISYSLPLSGESPSLTFSWEDSSGQAGAFTLEDAQLPHPLPSAEGELCNLRVTSLGWSRGSIEGVLALDCGSTTREVVSLRTVAGHHEETVTAALDGAVASITGTISVTAGGSHTTAPFVPGGETPFRLPVAPGEAVHPVSIEAVLEAAVTVAMPPMVRIIHHPGRTEERTERVRLVRPGTGRQVSRMVTVTHEDGATTEHVVSAYLQIPEAVIHRNVTLSIHHPEHLRAEVVEREPITRSRVETLALASSIGSDDPFRVLSFPPPEPGPEPSRQTALTEEEAEDLMGLLDWRELPW